ncbi:MAG TPA: mannosyltransferase family protein, partial [Pyrinomonadaceae bacterium]|nr:mannosyltransferase family protein [Pyrinomonadaceae bacterium]
MKNRQKNVAANVAAKESAAQTAREGAGRGRFFKRLDWPIVSLMLAVKALLFVFGAQAFVVLQNKRLDSPDNWLEIWNRWDAPHYLDIAQSGYVATGVESRWIVFYPLYPWLVRVFAFVFREYVFSAFVVSTLASIAAGLLLLRLAAQDEEQRVARGAVFFLFIFPTSYFLHIGYTESLFLALALGSFVAARERRWWLAGLLGAFTSLSRVNGLLLV